MPFKINPFTNEFDYYDASAASGGVNAYYTNYSLIAASRCNLSNASPTGSSVPTKTTRISYLPIANTNQVILVFGQWNILNSLGEGNGLNTVKIKASLEYLSASGPLVQDGARIPVYFKGERYADLAPDGILFSDPVSFDVTIGTQFFVRTNITMGGNGSLFPAGATTFGTTAAGALNNGEGSISVDYVDGTNTITPTFTQRVHAPIAILGYSTKALPTAAILGDSIAVGTSDGGYNIDDGGYLERALTGQTSLTYQTGVTPRVGFTKNARGSESITSFNTVSNSVVGSGGLKRTKLAILASTVISEYGTNDMSAPSLAALQARYLTFANTFLKAGQYYVACTLMPLTNSTDAWRTVTNQVVRSTESLRVGFNNWLRDTGPTGFAAQSYAPSKVSVFNAAAAVEVNAAGVLTTNGGFWPAALNGGVSVVTGTATSGTTAGSVADSTKSFTLDQYKGYVLIMTSGAALGTATTIYGNTATTILVNSSVSKASGDTYEIYQPYTIDGTHPSSLGHSTVAATFNIGLIR